MQAADGARRGGGGTEAAVGQERRGRRGHVVSTRRRGRSSASGIRPPFFFDCLLGRGCLVWRVVEINGKPRLTFVHVDLERPVLLLDFLGHGEDVREVGGKGFVLVLSVEAHLEGPDLKLEIAAAATAVAVAAAGAGVVPADKAPLELGALVDICHLFALLHAEHHALGLIDAADPEALHVGVDPRRQVRPRGVVELVVGPPLGLLYDDGVLGGHVRAKVAHAGEEQVTHLVRHQLIDDAPHQHRGRREGGRRGDGLLVRLHGLVVGGHGYRPPLLSPLTFLHDQVVLGDLNLPSDGAGRC